MQSCDYVNPHAPDVDIVSPRHKFLSDNALICVTIIVDVLHIHGVWMQSEYQI